MTEQHCALCRVGVLADVNLRRLVRQVVVEDDSEDFDFDSVYVEERGALVGEDHAVRAMPRSPER